MRKWLVAFYNSLWNPEWLKQHKNSGSAARRYFLLLIALFTIILAIPFVIMAAAFARQGPAALRNNLPDFTAALQGGKLSVTGLPQPYRAEKSFDGANFTLVVDTISSTTPNNWLSAGPNSSGIRVTASGIELVDNSTGQNETRSWQGAKDSSFSKIQLLSLVDRMVSQPTFTLLGAVFLVVLYAAMLIGELVVVLLAALGALALSRLAKRDWRYKELVNVALFAITLPLVIQTIFSLLGIQLPMVQFLALLALLVALIFTKERIVHELAESGQEVK